MGKTPRRGEPAEFGSSRERLLGTAKRLMAEAGYERVSTSSIAREAGSSESQLVRYFSSKAGLLAAILDESWVPLNSRIAALLSAVPTARQGVITVLSAMIGALARDRDLAKLLLLEGRRVRGDNAEILLTPGFRDFTRLLLNLIERGQKDRSFSTKLKPHVIASALLGAAEGMLRDRLVTAQQNQPSPASESQIRAVFAALVSGLAP